MEIFCRHRAGRNDLSPYRIVGHAMDHFASAGFHDLQLDYNYIICSPGNCHSDRRAKTGEAKKSLNADLSPRPVFTGFEYECAQSRANPFLVYLDGIFYQSGIAETRFTQFNLFTLGTGMGTMGG